LDGLGLLFRKPAGIERPPRHVLFHVPAYGFERLEEFRIKHGFHRCSRAIHGQHSRLPRERECLTMVSPGLFEINAARAPTPALPRFAGEGAIPSSACGGGLGWGKTAYRTRRARLSCSICAYAE